MADGVVVERHEGTPQGGPLSPLLANVLLDEVDKELEKRGHAFVRYADDCNVYVRSQASGRAGDGAAAAALREAPAPSQRVEERGRRRRGTASSSATRFWVAQGRAVKRRVAKKALAAMKERVRHITRRTGGRSIATGRRGAAELPRRLEGVLPAGGDAAHLRRPRRMDPPPPASHPPQAVEARHDDLSRAARPGSLRSTRPRRSPRNARRWWKNSGMAHPHRLPHQLLRRAGRSPARRVTSTRPNRRMRTRMPVVWEGTPRDYLGAPMPIVWVLAGARGPRISRELLASVRPAAFVLFGGSVVRAPRVSRDLNPGRARPSPGLVAPVSQSRIVICWCQGPTGSSSRRREAPAAAAFLGDGYGFLGRLRHWAATALGLFFLSASIPVHG